MIGEFIPFDARGTVEEARGALHRDGFLFLKSRIPPEVLRALHKTFSDAAYKAGWSHDHGSDDLPPVGRYAAACASPSPQYLDVYHALYAEQSLHCLTHLSQLTELAHQLVGPDAIVHPRIVGRIIFPRRPDLTTPPHQDFFQVRGSPNFVTFWIPLHDCSVSHGSLRVARGSHRLGLLPVAPSTGASGATVAVDPDALEWFGGDFQRGDVLVFDGMAVHTAGHNDSDLLRFSVDMRWQSRRELISERSLEFSALSGLDWETLTTGWDCDKHLTWRDEDLEIEPYSSEMTRERDDAALALAREGDIARSMAALQRIAAYDDNEQRRREARSLLDQLGAVDDCSN